MGQGVIVCNLQIRKWRAIVPGVTGDEKRSWNLIQIFFCDLVPLTFSKNAFSYWVCCVLTDDSGFYRGIRKRKEKATKNIRGQEDRRQGTEDGRKGQRMGERDRGWEKRTEDGRNGQEVSKKKKNQKPKNNNIWNSLVVQWLGHSAYIFGTQLRCLVRELRYHMPCCMVKILKKNFFF